MLNNVAVGPLVQVVLTEGDRTVPFSDIALEGDDAATISDRDLIARCQRWLDLPENRLAGYMVSRTETGNVLVAPKPTFG